MFSRQFRVALPSARGYIVVLSSLFGIGIALAAPGDLDPGFGENGLWSLTIGSSASDAFSVVQQSDGKLVLAGSAAVDQSASISSLRGWQQTGHRMPRSVLMELRPSISEELATLHSQ